MVGAGVRKVLVVDDDELFLAAFHVAVRGERWSVLTARDATTARRLADRERPDRAVVDLRLGDTSGIEVIRDLKQRLPDLRIALLSGYASVAHAVDAVKAGADAVILKPVAPREVLQRLDHDGPPSSIDELRDRPSLARMEFEYIARVMSDCRGNISKAARQLGIHRQSLQRRLKRGPPRE